MLTSMDGAIIACQASAAGRELQHIVPGRLGIQWANLDQELLQPAFSARNARAVSNGMALSGSMITPFAFLQIIPGLAARIL